MMESTSTGRVVSVVAEQCAHCSHCSVVPVVAIDARIATRALARALHETKWGACVKKSHLHRQVHRHRTGVNTYAVTTSSLDPLTHTFVF